MTARTWWRSIALLAALALVVAACPADDPTDDPPDDPGAVSFDIGVTEDPCPGGDPDRGCIYVGSISDFSGPFAAFGPQIVAGQEAFWARVNAEGGIGGLFDVHMSDHVSDAEYNPELHAREYAGMSADVLALTQTLGTPQTLGIVGEMAADNMIGAVLTWWSGWEFPDYAHVLQAGSNYCVDAMNGVEWAQDQYGIESIMTVYFPGDYGGDANAGVTIAAQELGIEFIEDYQQVPTILGGDTAGAVSAIVGASPDAVFMTVGPEETAQIVGGAAAQGFQGRFITSHPGYAHALLAIDPGLTGALEGLVNTVGPHENWGGDSDAHRAMQEALGEGEDPGNDGFTFGWIAAYPILAALEAAVEQGDLTRANVFALAQEVTVDFEGALPDKVYGGDPNETVVRTTTIGVPDSDGRLGLTTLETRFGGSVAEGHDFVEPCAPAV